MLCLIVRSYWHSFQSIIVSLSCHVYNFITCHYWIINKTFYLSIMWQPGILGFKSNNQAYKDSKHSRCFIEFLHSHRRKSLICFWFELHSLPWNTHLRSRKICFVHIFDSFILVIILKIFEFASVLFVAQILQLLLHLSKLTIMDDNEFYLDLNQLRIGLAKHSKDI